MEKKRKRSAAQKEDVSSDDTGSTEISGLSDVPMADLLLRQTTSVEPTSSTNPVPGAHVCSLVLFYRFPGDTFSLFVCQFEG